ncbi:isopentenyl-diphosphate Delta-isomerase [Stenotrophomonas maltophilia]|uniref:isopentenyl-diphosphate Delta-isomerase n=1 Tax=Stenotrophomonas maltophilia TaxID=40324 RepID=UPI003BF8B5C8
MDTLEAACVESQLIAVSVNDEPIGPIGKADCHAGEGVLHRAFSLFLFNRQGQVLLQQRSALKPLWPGYWANSCCSHPRWGEELPIAVSRRAREELGVMLTAPLTWHFSFIYHARYLDVGSETELCHVYSALLEDVELHVDPNEVCAHRWIKSHELDAALREEPDVYSPWLHREWPALRAGRVSRPIQRDSEHLRTLLGRSTSLDGPI